MDLNSKNKDPFGAAIRDFANTGNNTLEIEVFQEDFEPDVIPVKHLFRDYKNMPKIEQKALELARGRVLDIGAAAGCHSKFLKQKGFEIYPIDISALSTQYLKSIDFENAQCNNLFDYNPIVKFDTILMLMNGLGVAENIQGLNSLFYKLKQLLNPGGQVLLDTSDLKFLFEEEDGSFLIPLDKYYGETRYQIKYKEHTTDWFPWLYIDIDTLSFHAQRNGFKCTLIQSGDHYDYLAKLELC